MRLSLLISILSIAQLLSCESKTLEECVVSKETKFDLVSKFIYKDYEKETNLVLDYHNRLSKVDVVIWGIYKSDSSEIVKFVLQPIEGRDYQFIYYLCKKNGRITKGRSPGLALHPDSFMVY